MVDWTEGEDWEQGWRTVTARMWEMEGGWERTTVDLADLINLVEFGWVHSIWSNMSGTPFLYSLEI